MVAPLASGDGRFRAGSKVRVDGGAHCLCADGTRPRGADETGRTGDPYCAAKRSHSRG